MNNYKVRFDYLKLIEKAVAVKSDWYPVTAYTPTEALLIVLNSCKLSMGQLVYVEIKRI